MSHFASSRRTLSYAAMLLAVAGALPAVAAERSTDSHERYLQGGPALASMPATVHSRSYDSARAYERVLNGSPITTGARGATQLDASVAYQRYLNGTPTVGSEGQLDVAYQPASTLN